MARDPGDMDEIRRVVDDHVRPAAAALKHSVDEGDADAVRAYAYELLVVTGIVIAACRDRGAHGRFAKDTGRPRRAPLRCAR